MPERVEAQVSGIMSSSEFAGLELSAPTQAAVEKQGFRLMTEVQARTIPHLLAGRDVLGAAKTGALAAEAFLARLPPMHLEPVLLILAAKKQLHDGWSLAAQARARRWRS